MDTTRKVAEIINELWLIWHRQYGNKFRIKDWVKINANEQRTYDTNIKVKFKIAKVGYILCDYSYA